MRTPEKSDPDFNHLTARWSARPSLEADSVSLAGRLYAHTSTDTDVQTALIRQATDINHLQSFVQELANQNTQAGHPLTVGKTEGTHLTGKEWLAVEQDMVASVLQRALSASPSPHLGSAIVAIERVLDTQLNVPETSYATFYQHLENEYQEGPEFGNTLFLKFATAMLLMLLAIPIMIMADVAILNTKHSLHNLLTSAGTFGVAIFGLIGIMVLSPNHYFHRNEAILTSVSDSWEEALSLKTPADCVFIAQLYLMLCNPKNTGISLAGLNVHQACKLAFAPPSEQNAALALLVDSSHKTAPAVPVPVAFNKPSVIDTTISYPLFNADSTSRTNDSTH